MSLRDKQSASIGKGNAKVTDHAWKGTWERPVKVDEDSFDPLTVARMTDHNVRGSDDERSAKRSVNPEESPTSDVSLNSDNDGGKVSPEEAMRIQSKDLP